MHKSLSAVLLTILPIAVGSGLHAASLPAADAKAPAAAAFAHYIANLDQARPWSPETVDIDASLPKLKKQGRLRAIRRLLPLGGPHYQVLESSGDETVQQRIIMRYLTAEAQASEMPASSVAISPANYNFRYKGPVESGDRTTYVFQITPRKKRDGMIKGEIWLDGETGAVVRQTGRLVKSPSIFLKRVEVNREIVLDQGLAQARITHLILAVRFVGPAELTIVERPYERALTAANLPASER